MCAGEMPGEGEALRTGLGHERGRTGRRGGRVSAAPGHDGAAGPVVLERRHADSDGDHGDGGSDQAAAPAGQARASATRGPPSARAVSAAKAELSRSHAQSGIGSAVHRPVRAQEVEPGEGLLDSGEVVGVDLVVDVSRVVLVSHARAHLLPPL